MAAIFQGTLQQLRSQWPFTRREEGAPHGPGFAAILAAAAPQTSAKKRSPARNNLIG
jgi:hypothetical protein